MDAGAAPLLAAGVAPAVASMSPWLFQLLFALAILAAGALGGWLPLAGDGRSGKRFMSWSNAFAAGVFLGTGLIHMLGESSRAWQELGWSYPMAPLLAAAGFLAFLFAEHVLLPPSAHAVSHAHSGEALPASGLAALERPGIPYALLVALSIHSAIAGVALGAQRELAGALYIFLAIVAHKSSAGFALGVSLARSSVPPRRGRALVALFAAMTPLGILVGAVASGLLRGGAGRYFDATFEALAAGSCVYIASMDSLQDEFLHAGGRLAKWAWAAAAVALTALLSIWL